MVKLLLTSTGLANQKIKDQFMKLINKPVSKAKVGFIPTKVLFIPTASRTKEELHYVNLSMKELIDFGIPKKNIKVLTLEKPVSFEESSFNTQRVIKSL